MATQNKIIEMIAAIKTIYSYYAKDTNIEMLVKTWSVLLRDYDDQMVDMAFYKCLQTCKVPPTPADVIEKIGAMTKTLEQSDEELWSIYCGALRETVRLVAQFGYTYVDSTGISQGQQAKNKLDTLWAGLPDKIKRYLSDKSELIRNARDSNADEGFLTWEKQRFMKNMPIMEKRQEYHNFLLDSGNKSKFLIE